MADYLGDRVLQVEVLDPGLYENSTELNVTLDYDPSEHTTNRWCN